MRQEWHDGQAAQQPALPFRGAQPSPRLKVFCSYAHKDERYREQLERALAPLHRQELFETWFDWKMLPGHAFDPEIEKRLNAADIVLLLISPDFFYSNYCHQVELKQSLELQKEGHVLLVPILVRPVEMRGGPLERLVKLPRNEKPITEWRNRDKAWQEVVAGIRDLSSSISASRSEPGQKQLEKISAHLPPAGGGQKMPAEFLSLLDPNELLPITYLKRGLQASRAVARVQSRGEDGQVRSLATGFLVSPRLFLTCHHVLGTAQEAGRSEVQFDDEMTAGTDRVPSTTLRLDPTAFFMTSAELDFTLVAVGRRVSGKGSLEEYGWLSPGGEGPRLLLGERVNLILHASGGPKQVAFGAATFALFSDYLHYRVITPMGSSGAPVLNAQWEVVGIHHMSVPKRDVNGQILSIDGALWTQDMGTHRVAWAGKEAVLSTSILRYVRDQPLKGLKRQLREELLTPWASPLEASRRQRPGVRRPRLPH